jgi:hypothetical protein
MAGPRHIQFYRTGQLQAGLVRSVKEAHRNLRRNLIRGRSASASRGRRKKEKGAVTQLIYDPRDDAYHERIGSQILYWLDDLGAVPPGEADPASEGFLFAGARPIGDYRELVGRLPLVRDRPDEREPLLRLDSVLEAIDRAGVPVAMPRTWVLLLDAPLPDDLSFPLFVRTAETSWKKGGRISRVATAGELLDEAAELRRGLGWDAAVLAREWLELAVAGEGRYGPVAQEIRVWAVDGVPAAWSFHHLHVVPSPRGFPPSPGELAVLRGLAAQVALAFRSRLVVADFARGDSGGWWFIEAGPGSCAGTAHEAVFKAVAKRLRGEADELEGDATGGPL